MHTEASVVIPTYKRPAFLRQALESVYRAAKSACLEGRALEIVVVDDGHCNELQEISETAKNTQPYSITYLRTNAGPGAGPAKARNQGVFSAGGDYIFLLDDDDQFLADRFHRSLSLLRSGQYDAVLERTLRVYADEAGLPYETGPADGITVDAFTYLITGDEGSHITPGATCFTKKIFVKLAGYDEALQQGEDGEFLLRLCAAGRVALRAGQPVALTTIHKHNTSRPENRKYWHNIEALRHLYRNLRRMGASKEVAVVKKCVSGKLDYLLTRIKVEELRYFERLRSGAITLLHYPVDCLTWNNLKSIYVFFVR